MPDDELDLAEIEGLLNSIPARLVAAPNRLRYTMNGFVISVGTYVSPLFRKAAAIAKQIAVVSVDMGDTACKVPLAAEALAESQVGGRGAAKRNTIRC